MTTRFTLKATFALACLCYAVAPASADLVISSYQGVAGNDSASNSTPGMELTVQPNNGVQAFDVTSFNWYQNPSSPTAYAFGNLYILNAAYYTVNSSNIITLTSNGTVIAPSNLNTLTAANGLVGELSSNGTTSSNGTAYTTTGTVSLLAGTTYFFLSDTEPVAPLTGVEQTYPISPAAPPGFVARFRAPDGTTSPGFASAPATPSIYDYSLNGIATPEPSTMAMIASGTLAAACSFGVRRLRNRNRAAA